MTRHLSLSAAVLLSSSCQSRCQRWERCRSFSSNLSGMLTDATLIAHKDNTHKGKQLLKRTLRLETDLMWKLQFVFMMSSIFKANGFLTPPFACYNQLVVSNVKYLHRSQYSLSLYYEHFLIYAVSSSSNVHGTLYECIVSYYRS